MNEGLPPPVDASEQGRSPSWNDIPKFGLGKFYVYSNLAFSMLMILMAVSRQAPANARARDLGAWSFAFIVVMVLYLGLRKRKRYGLILFYILMGLHIFITSINIIAGKSLLINRVVSSGLLVGIVCALLVYFYKRRQYFNR